jgi:hypothetical protein
MARKARMRPSWKQAKACKQKTSGSRRELVTKRS